MQNNFHSLSHELLTPGTTVLQRFDPENASVAAEDEAFTVMTDFRHVRPFSISPRGNLEEINQRMISCGVRLLFVADAGGALLGLLTHTDLFGEKPMRYIQEHGGTREQILAQDIMTPLARLESLSWSAVQRARVGDIVATIKAAGRQHMLVNDTIDGNNFIVGMFSSTQIEKLTGERLEISSRASTFADIEKALS